MRRTKRSGFKTALKVIAAVLALVILAACVVFFWHFPRYALQKKPMEITMSDSGEIRMMSYNLRYIAPTDLGKQSWFYRARLILSDIQEQAPGVIGFQEATRVHYGYLVDVLEGYDSVITYRNNSIVAEGCPIFYSTELYELVDKGSFWLSETPEVMSKDWGSAHYRVCSYVILKDRTSGKEFVVFNTHLDHVSDEARINGIGVVLDKIEAFGSLPAVIMGDFNAVEGSRTYESVTEHFLDAMYAAERTEDSYTYQNWGNLENAKRIDYFMLSRSGFAVQEYDVLTELHDGVYSSDHCPIVLTVTLE